MQVSDLQILHVTFETWKKMMRNYYTTERNAQIVISLMKAHGVKKVIASPGTTNLTFVASLQQDSFFEMYSAPDERSAAYMACGLAAETGEAVALSCTGATASRNYMPALTEAYYRKLPILAITSAQHTGRIANLHPQVIDRRILPNDIARLSVQLPAVHDREDEWACEILANRALLELRRFGGSPVHINLVTTYSKDFSTQELPPVHVINRVCPDARKPEMPTGQVAVWVGAHQKWNDALTSAVDEFCTAHDAVVFCDQTSNYRGKFRMLYSLACSQQKGSLTGERPDLLIHIGEISGDYPLNRMASQAEVWRVSPDGEICDLFSRLRYVFEMNELDFFKYYTSRQPSQSHAYFDKCKKHLDKLYADIPELPFSNIWIASRMAAQIPDGAVLHLGILNSLRAWNFFETPQSVLGYSNTGGFGIDGCVSALIGASLADRQKLYFGVVGDLAFFYDMNALGNRHIGNNVRILLVNNGKGTEFRNFTHPGAAFGEEADAYIAAGGHYGNKSRKLVKHYAQNLGFEYLSASSKEEFEAVYQRFLTPQATADPMLFEVFTNSREESEALKRIMYLENTAAGEAKALIKQLLGEKGIAAVKKILGKS